jgi:hypothetical protein
MRDPRYPSLLGADPLRYSFTLKPSGKRFPSSSGRVANAVKSLPTAWGRVVDELFDPARECRQGFEQGNDPARECRQPFESGYNLPRKCRRVFEGLEDPAPRLECPRNSVLGMARLETKNNLEARKQERKHFDTSISGIPGSRLIDWVRFQQAGSGCGWAGATFGLSRPR